MRTARHFYDIFPLMRGINMLRLIHCYELNSLRVVGVYIREVLLKKLSVFISICYERSDQSFLIITYTHKELMVIFYFF